VIFKKIGGHMTLVTPPFLKIFKGAIISGLTLETRLSNLFEVRIALIVLEYLTPDRPVRCAHTCLDRQTHNPMKTVGLSPTVISFTWRR